MKAVRYFGPGQPFQLVEVPIPDLQAGEVLVRIRAAGMCHTELHFESGLLNLGIAPLTMGHEIAGTIEAVGARGDEAPLAGRDANTAAFAGRSPQRRDRGRPDNTRRTTYTGTHQFP